MKKILVLLLAAASGMFAQVVQPIQVTGIIDYINSPLSASLNVAGLYVPIIGSHYAQGSMLVPVISGGAMLPNVNLSGAGWFMLINNDPTNYITVLTGVGGTPFLRMLPGEFAMGRFAPVFGGGPAVQANGSPANMSYLIIEP